MKAGESDFVIGILRLAKISSKICKRLGQS